jgi:hypothetical protein
VVYNEGRAALFDELLHLHSLSFAVKIPRIVPF